VRTWHDLCRSILSASTAWPFVLRARCSLNGAPHATQVLERGERIEVLVDKTEDLQAQAERFQVQGRNLRAKMWWQNMKVKALVAIAIVVVVILLFCTICFSGGNCLKK
jgi:Synaptobrevin